MKATLIFDYFKKLGIINLLILFSLYVVKSGADGMSDIWLTYWTNAMQSNLTNGTVELTPRMAYFHSFIFLLFKKHFNLVFNFIAVTSPAPTEEEALSFTSSLSNSKNIPLSSWYYFGIYSALGFSSTLLSLCINVTLVFVITNGISLFFPYSLSI